MPATTGPFLRSGTPRSGLRSLCVAVAVLVCIAAASEAMGCPNCKDAVDTADPDGLNVARGYFYSILIMLAMPFTLVGSFGVYVWREMRRAKQSAGEGVASPPPVGLAVRPRSPTADLP